MDSLTRLVLDDPGGKKMGAGIVAFPTVGLWHVVFLHMHSAWLFTLVTLHGISGNKVMHAHDML